MFHFGLSYHFEALAVDSRAASSSVQSILPSTTADGLSLLRGQQTVAKYRKTDADADLVHVFLALWRIPDKNADFVFTVRLKCCTLCCNQLKLRHQMNVPIGRAAEVQSVPTSDSEWALFQAAAKSLTFVDYGLFV